MSMLAEALSCYPPLIEDVALAIADDAYPNLSRMRYHGMLDEMSRPLFEPMRVIRDKRARLDTFRTHLCDGLGFSGNRESYYDPRNSFLNEVLERRRGIPISLAVVWMAIGRRVGMRVEGIGFPGHFLVRVGGDDGALVDVFNDGHTLGTSELHALAARYRLPRNRVHDAVQSVSAHEIAQRMLSNLRNIYMQQADHARAMLICDRLYDLTAAPSHRRDRGLHAMQLGATVAALQDIESYVVSCPDAPDTPRLTEVLTRLSRDVARMN